ncbi:unnamed protein product [marine sediment metagenome]|uniref:Uncharacterized protein n=1 Tax=marine sediment metagenome TaxID=412755 RepID=X1TK99_9ZZZZ
MVYIYANIADYLVRVVKKPFFSVLNKTTRQVEVEHFKSLMDCVVYPVWWCHEWVHAKSLRDILEGFSYVEPGIKALADAIIV